MQEKNSVPGVMAEATNFNDLTVVPHICETPRDCQFKQ